MLARLTAVEMRRALHRRLVIWMIVIAAAGNFLVGLIVFLSSQDSAYYPQAEGNPARMVNWWSPDDGGYFLITAAVFLIIGAVICGASIAGAEWRAGTMTTMLTWVPSRVRLHLARTSSAGLLAFVISFLLQIVYLLSAMPAVIFHGDTGGTDAAWLVALLLAMIRISFITMLVAVLAVNIATIGRNTSAALIAIATWVLILERMAVGFWPRTAPYMITENVVTVVPWAQLNGVGFERSPIVALLILVMYLTTVVIAATVLFARRDVS